MCSRSSRITAGTKDQRDLWCEEFKHEWARLKANDSLECRNCHSEVAMDLTRQTPRDADIHTRFLLSGEATCIDCHKGIAHQLPDMTGVEPGWKVAPELQGQLMPTSPMHGKEPLAAVLELASQTN